MQTTTKSGRIIRLPTEEEEAAIQRGIDSDPDNPELAEEFFRNARPAKEVLPPKQYAGLLAMNRRAGVRGPGLPAGYPSIQQVLLEGHDTVVEALGLRPGAETPD